MNPLTEIEVREAFHIHLLAAIPDEYRLAHGTAALRLKGGVNLRLHHASPRYSEDIDFDLRPQRGKSLAARAGKLLDLPAFRAGLLRVGITDLEVSPASVGDRGYRQKFRAVYGGLPLPTKIEVSFREETPWAITVVHRIADDLLARYGLPGRTVEFTAYMAEAAIGQKVLALAHRVESQTRDAFDLHLLLGQEGGKHRRVASDVCRQHLDPRVASTAMEVLASFSPKMYDDQTLAFLPGGEGLAHPTWGEIQSVVGDWLATLSAGGGSP